MAHNGMENSKALGERYSILFTVEKVKKKKGA